MDFITQSIVIGLTEQAPLVLAAIGFALLYRLTGLINVAYAETVTLGAYFGMWINTTFELNFFVTLVPTAILSGLLSVGTYLLIFRPAKRRNVGTLEFLVGDRLLQRVHDVCSHRGKLCSLVMSGGGVDLHEPCIGIGRHIRKGGVAQAPALARLLPDRAAEIEGRAASLVEQARALDAETERRMQQAVAEVRDGAVYLTSLDEEEKRLELPEGTPLGLAVFVHGGYWHLFGKDAFSHVAEGAVEAHQVRDHAALGDRDDVRVLGGGIGYAIGLYGGRPLLYRFFNDDKIHAVERLYDRYNAWATGIAGLTPIPYKVFTIAGGAFKVNFTVFVVASAVSRSLRFMVEGALLFFFGAPIRDFLFRWFNWLSIAFVILLVGGFWFLVNMTVFGFISGLVATQKVTQGAEDHDPSWIVIDEVVGQWIALFPVSLGAYSAGVEVLRLWAGIVAAFVFFRLFDIWKPWLVGRADRRGDATGVMLDDVWAGLFAAPAAVVLIGLFAS